jgi:carbon storage regulator CsrA
MTHAALPGSTEARPEETPMLVISRKKNESIVINNDIVLTVVEIRGDKVRLGVVCPKEVPVHRQEVYDAIHDWPVEPWTPPAPRSPDEAALLQAILADPDDDAPRLIYADWLEEQGDPRGEFIRVQCWLAALSPGDHSAGALQEREHLLLSRHGAAWRSALPPLLRQQPFERGFVETACLTAQEFLANVEGLFALAPIRHLRVWASSFAPLGERDLSSLAASPYLARLASLDLSDNGLGDDAAVVLASSARLGSLSTLVLRQNRIGDAGAAALARSPHLAALTALDLAGNQIGTPGARALAASRHLTKLARLDLSGNPVGEETEVR